MKAWPESGVHYEDTSQEPTMRPTVLAQLAFAVVALVTLVGCQDERCTSCEAAPSGRAAAITAASAGTGHDHGAATPAAAGAGAHDHGAAGGMSCKSPAALVATIHPTKGNTAAGVVRFTTVPAGVRIVADISGLTPSAKHAIHIHEFGDVSADDGSAAGGHYNPGGHTHGGPETEHHHAGDLGNLSTDAAGNAHYELVVKDLTLCCGKAPVIGRSIIIHAKEDDLASQPAGNAGPRIAQGVIGIAK
jgi:superoxide dismutase, Cu-Zn family